MVTMDIWEDVRNFDCNIRNVQIFPEFHVSEGRLLGLTTLLGDMVL